MMHIPGILPLCWIIRYAVAVYGEGDTLPTSRLFAMNRVCLSANKVSCLPYMLVVGSDRR